MVIVRGEYSKTVLRNGNISDFKKYEKVKICKTQPLESEKHANKDIFTTRESSG